MLKITKDQWDRYSGWRSKGIAGGRQPWWLDANDRPVALEVEGSDLMQELSKLMPKVLERVVQTFLAFEADEAQVMRLLSDGRRLGLFPRPPRFKRISVQEAVEVDGQKMWVPRLRFLSVPSRGFVVAINDDQSGAWWRPLRNCNSRSLGQQVMNAFREGDDCRRRAERRFSGAHWSPLNSERRKGDRRVHK